MRYELIIVWMIRHLISLFLTAISEGIKGLFSPSYCAFRWQHKSKVEAFPRTSAKKKFAGKYLITGVRNCISSHQDKSSLHLYPCTNHLYVWNTLLFCLPGHFLPIWHLAKIYFQEVFWMDQNMFPFVTLSFYSNTLTFQGVCMCMRLSALWRCGYDPRVMKVETKAVWEPNNRMEQADILLPTGCLWQWKRKPRIALGWGG